MATSLKRWKIPFIFRYREGKENLRPDTTPSYSGVVWDVWCVVWATSDVSAYAKAELGIVIVEPVWARRALRDHLVSLGDATQVPKR